MFYPLNMKKTFKVRFDGRRRGHIGIFYPCELYFKGNNKEDAEDKLFRIDCNPDYEVNNVYSVVEISN
jgi:hypothetical protein